MNKISRILLVAVIISILFAGVATAKKLDVRDEHGDNVGPNKYVKIEHTDHDGHRDSYIKETDEHGQIDDAVGPEHPDDRIEEGDRGKSDENNNGDFNDREDKDCHTEEPPVNGIPEFPTVALPIAAVIGMVFLFQNRKKKQ